VGSIDQLEVMPEAVKNEASPLLAGLHASAVTGKLNLSAEFLQVHCNM
jgi:hypothetical protein